MLSSALGKSQKRGRYGKHRWAPGAVVPLSTRTYRQRRRGHQDGLAPPAGPLPVQPILRTHDGLPRVPEPPDRDTGTYPVLDQLLVENADEYNEIASQDGTPTTSAGHHEAPNQSFDAANAQVESDEWDSEWEVSSVCSSSSEQCDAENNCNFQDNAANSTEDEDGDAADFWVQPLYLGSDVTIGEAVVDVLELFSEHKLTKSCLNDILQMLFKFLPSSNLLPNTKYKFFNLLTKQIEAFETIKHRFCNDCPTYFGLFEETKDIKVCHHCSGVDVNAIFIEIPVSETMKLLLEKCNISEHFVERNPDSNVLRDIVDGQLSRDLNEKKWDMHLIWNTDGAPVFRSSNGQIWPILYTVCNLAPKLRQRYVCLGGLWYGKTKPTMNTFLKPFATELCKLETLGLEWFHPSQKTIIRSVIRAPLISVDSKARSEMQGMTACNGERGCSFCEHPTAMFIMSKTSRVRIFPVVHPEPKLRTKRRMISQATRAVTKKKPGAVMGMQLPMCLSLVQSIDIARSFVPDPLHLFFQGLMKALCKLWLLSKHHREDWYIGTRKDDIDQILKSLKPPTTVARPPRSLAEIKHWKASEYRNFALWYGPVCLKNILPRKYFQHFLLFASATFILSQQEVSRSDLTLAKVFLKLFCEDFQNLYGMRHMSFTVHQLQHIAQAVEDWGPMWGFSCFMFENMNGVLLSMIHGTQRIAEQLTLTIKLQRALLDLKHRMGKEEARGPEVRALGAKFTLDADKDAITHEIARYLTTSELPPVPVSNLLFFKRVEIRGKGRFHSVVYDRGEKRDSTVVEYASQMDNILLYGKIQCFVQIPNGVIFAVVRKLDEDTARPPFIHRNTEYTLKQFVAVTESDLHVINASQILRLAHNFGSFIGKVPNDIEINL